MQNMNSYLKMKYKEGICYIIMDPMMIFQSWHFVHLHFQSPLFTLQTYPPVHQILTGRTWAKVRVDESETYSKSICTYRSRWLALWGLTSSWACSCSLENKKGWVNWKPKSKTHHHRHYPCFLMQISGSSVFRFTILIIAPIRPWLAEKRSFAIVRDKKYYWNGISRVTC